ncbi:MAG TPA: hypothetical protein VKB05_03870 [Pyrinomonadaceae bacterium]|nr:hypothetical protein [Pyrinomonadaceae bacterium]
MEYFDTVLSGLFLAYADTSLTESQFALKLLRFTELTKKLRMELSEQFTKHHLAWASTDPMYVGDPYRKLPDGASVMLGPVKTDYHFFDHITVDDPDFRVNPSSLQHAGSKYPPVPTIEGWTITGAMGGNPRSPEKTKQPKKPGRKLRKKKNV